MPDLLSARVGRTEPVWGGQSGLAQHHKNSSRCRYWRHQASEKTKHRAERGKAAGKPAQDTKTAKKEKKRKKEKKVEEAPPPERSERDRKRRRDPPGDGGQKQLRLERQGPDSFLVTFA